MTPAYQRISGQTTTVEVEICNTSTTSDAARTWITFDDTTSLTVTAVELIDDPLNPVALTVEPFAGGSYVHLDAKPRVNGVNPATAVCDVLRVMVQATGCGRSGMRMASGWACDAVAPAGWTPTQDQACIDDRGLVEIEPIAPFLEADLVDQPAGSVDLCVPLTLEFQVNNAGVGTAYDIAGTFRFPEGLTYIPGSAQVEYPADDAADDFQPVVNDLVAADTTVRGFGWAFGDLGDVHPYLGSDGLMGFDPSNPTDSNRYVLRLTFETNCDYRSGSIVYFDAEGREACGALTNEASAESSAIQITGVEPDGSHLYEVGLVPGGRISSSQATSRIELFVRNTGTAPTDADDFVEFVLSDGYAYEPGTTTGTLPSGYAPGEPASSITAGMTELEWPLPVGLQPGEEARLSFEVRPDILGCGPQPQVSITAIRYMTALCVSAASNCRIRTDVTSGGGQLVGIPLGDQFVVTTVASTSVCETASTELVYLELELSPSGFDFSGTDLTVGLYVDRDADGIAGPGDDLLDQQSLGNAPGDASVVYVYAASLPRVDLGSLVLRVDSAGTTLCAPQNDRLAPPQLDNAGADLLTLCLTDGNTLQLGEPACVGAADAAFAWTTEPAGYQVLLDDANAPRPTLTVPASYAGPDSLAFVLATTRTGVGVTRDTVRVRISPGVVLGPGGDERIDYGDQVVLTPDVQSGVAPYTYAWSPAVGLGSTTDAQPIASPEFTQVYTLDVTDAFGCTASTTYRVVVNNPIDPNPSVTDTTLCPDADLAIRVDGANVTWTPDPANPGTGGLDRLTGNDVVFDPAGGTGVYAFDAYVTDPAYPGYDSTVTITITVDPNGPGCAPPCTFPTLASELTVAADCGQATGAAYISFAPDAAGYALAWVDAGGDTIAREVESLNGLAAGAYTLVVRDLSDGACVETRTLYVANEGAPEANVTTTPAACAASDGTASLTPAALDYLWPDGSTADTRDDLAAGTYRVRVADPSDPACFGYATVVVGEAPGLQVSVTVDAQPSCTGRDGAATLSVTGGSGNYSYSWAGNAPTRTNLAAGGYTVVVTDDVTGCEASVSFVLGSTPFALTIDATEPETCPGAADGTVGYTVPDMLAPSVATVIAITAAGDTLSADGPLPAGRVCLVALDAGGCALAGDCAEIAAATPIELDAEASEACGIPNGVVRWTVRNGQAPLTVSFSDGRSTQADSLGWFDPGTYALTVTDALGCAASADVAVGQCGPCGYAPSAGDTVLAQAACAGTAAVCIAGIADRADAIAIYTNDSLYTGNRVPCDYGRTRLTYLVGVLDFAVPLEVRLSVDGVAQLDTVATLTELVGFFQASDPAGAWGYEASSLTVIGGTRDGAYSPLEVRRLGSGLTTTIAYNERIEPYGLAIELSPGFHRIVVLDDGVPCADTLYADIRCAPVDTLRLTVEVDSSDVFCLSTGDLAGTPTSIVDVCPDDTFASYDGLVRDTCVAVTGVAVGQQQGCWVVCDDAGICDTTIVLIDVIPNGAVLEYRDTILVGRTGSLCLTAAEVGLARDPLTLTNTCPGSAGAFVGFFDGADGGHCIDYDGLAVGEEAACLQVCDADNNCRDATLTVVVLEAKRVVRDTVFINQTAELCFAEDGYTVTTPMPATFEHVDTISRARCFAYRGLALGTDTVGLRGVGADGELEDVCLVVTVAPYDGGVRTQSDSTCTDRNTPVRVNVLANDEVFGGVASFELVGMPPATTGTVVVNSDNTITFTPAPDVCSRTAEIRYRVCNPNEGVADQCLTEVVRICIRCDELTVFTALSPNGDGVNDFFWVDGIERFPDNRVRIYNRWGNLVFETSGYRNDWAGTYLGDRLPDGAYFYVLDVRDQTGMESTYRGYVEVSR